jgi:aspartyl-tRNA(Asn)/glutamyl-tRNA(Gln) amidotransferase subunit A
VSGAALWSLTATQLAARFAAGSATPDEALAAVLARHDAVNDTVNAVITLDRAGARAAAAASTTRWRAGRPASPLDGVPLTVKDNILVKGLRATWGSALFADFVPEQDETPVARLREAGLVILGKTNVPEFTVQGITDNALFGPTRNPRDPALTPGGSSGGAVAAVALGICPLALCTDGGGSIRRPAGHTGLVGLKPSRGCVPRRHGFPAILHDFEVAGPIGRSIADVRALLALIGTPGPAPAPRPLRIAHVPTFGDAPVDPQIAGSVAAAAQDLARRGHAVTRLDDFRLADPINAQWPVVAETGVAWLFDTHPRAATLAGPDIAAMAARGRGHAATAYLAMLDTVARCAEDFADLFADYDVLLLPTAAAQPWPIGIAFPPQIDGRAVGPRGHAVFTAFANALGLPALSVPGRPDRAGLPIGLQLCGPQGSDARLLALGEELEQMEQTAAA